MPLSAHGKVVGLVRQFASALPGDLRVVVLAAFGLHDGVPLADGGLAGIAEVTI